MNRRMLLTVLFCVSSVQAVWQDKTFLQDGQLAETDQYVQVFVYDSPPATTNIAINGGQIGTLFTHDNSRTVISGGIFSGEYYQYHPENNDGDNVILAPYESRVYT